MRVLKNELESKMRVEASMCQIGKAPHESKGREIVERDDHAVGGLASSYAGSIDPDPKVE